MISLREPRPPALAVFSSKGTRRFFCSQYAPDAATAILENLPEIASVGSVVINCLDLLIVSGMVSFLICAATQELPGYADSAVWVHRSAIASSDPTEVSSARVCLLLCNERKSRTWTKWHSAYWPRLLLADVPVVVNVTTETGIGEDLGRLFLRTFVLTLRNIRRSVFARMWNSNDAPDRTTFCGSQDRPRRLGATNSDKRTNLPCLAKRL